MRTGHGPEQTGTASACLRLRPRRPRRPRLWGKRLSRSRLSLSLEALSRSDLQTSRLKAPKTLLFTITVKKTCAEPAPASILVGFTHPYLQWLYRTAVQPSGRPRITWHLTAYCDGMELLFQRSRIRRDHFRTKGTQMPTLGYTVSLLFSVSQVLRGLSSRLTALASKESTAGAVAEYLQSVTADREAPSAAGFMIVETCVALWGHVQR